MLIYTDKERRMLYMGYDVLEVCRHVINYSNEKEYGISNLKLQKVLYFIQAYFLIDKTKMHLVLMIKSKHGILAQLFLLHIMNISNMVVEISQQ